MSAQNPLDPLLEALRNAGAPPDATTRFATVTGGSSTTLTVRFDGETIASSRAYVKTYAPASVGDRVIMLRAGSTWVAIARIPTATTPPDSGRVALTPGASMGVSPYGIPTAVVLRNGWVHLNVELQAFALRPAGSILATFPAMYAPVERVWQSAGSPFGPNRAYSIVATNAAGGARIENQHDIPNTEVLLCSMAWPSAL